VTLHDVSCAAPMAQVAQHSVGYGKQADHCREARASRVLRTVIRIQEPAMARGDLHGGQPLEGIEDRSRRNAPRRGMNHFHVRLSVCGSGPALVTSRGNGVAAIGLTPDLAPHAYSADGGAATAHQECE
jgi:hypothetical protein